MSERTFGHAWVVERLSGARRLTASTPIASFNDGLVVLDAVDIEPSPPRVQLLLRGGTGHDLKVFVHLYRGGQLVGQIDAPLRERMNYVLPAAGGEASVEVGVYRPDGRRLTTSFPENRVPIGMVR
jgi:hypothetical protein